MVLGKKRKRSKRTPKEDVVQIGLREVVVAVGVVAIVAAGAWWLLASRSADSAGDRSANGPQAALDPTAAPPQERAATTAPPTARPTVMMEPGTWITEDMIQAYSALHRAGHAHSVEARCGDTLSGGIYGVSIGRCFFGESMFSQASNVSKVALVTLVEHMKRHGFVFMDCQVTTGHLVRVGAREIPRSRFLTQLEQAVTLPPGDGA